MKNQSNGPQLNESAVRDFLNIESQYRAGSSSKDGSKGKPRSQGHSSKSFLKTLQMNLSEMSRRNASARQVASTADKKIQGKNYSYNRTSSIKSTILTSNNGDKNNELLVNLDKPQAKTLNKLLSDPGQNRKIPDSDVISRNAVRYHTCKHSSKTAESMGDNSVTFRKRSNSYVMAVDPFEVDSNKVALNLNNTVANTKTRRGSESGERSNSYVQTTITKFENNSKCEDNIELRRKVQSGVKDNIDNLFKNYHRKVKVGTSKKEEIQKLSKEINEIIQNSVRSLNKCAKNNEVNDKTAQEEISNVITDDKPIETHVVEDITLIYHKEDELKNSESSESVGISVSDEVFLQKDSEDYNNIISITTDNNTIIETCTVIADKRDTIADVEKLILEEIAKNEAISTDEVGPEETQYVVYLQEDDVKEQDGRNIFEYWKMMQLKEKQKDPEIDERILRHLSDTNSTVSIKNYSLEISDTGEERILKQEFKTPEQNKIDDLKNNNSDNEEKTCDFEEPSNCELSTVFLYEEIEDINEENDDLKFEELCVSKELGKIDVGMCSDSEETSSVSEIFLEEKILTPALENVAPSEAILDKAIQNIEQSLISDKNSEEVSKPEQQQLKADEYSHKMEAQLEDTSPNMSGEKRISFLHSNKTSICSESDNFTDFSPRHSRLYGGSFKGRSIISEKKNEDIRKQIKDAGELSIEDMERYKILNSRLFNGSFKGRALVSDNFNTEEKDITSPTLLRKCSTDSNTSEFDRSFNNLIRNSVYRKSFRRKSTARTEEEIEDVAINLTKNDSMKSNDSSSTARSRRTKLYNLFRSSSKTKNKDSNNNKGDTEPENLILHPKSPPSEIDELFTDAESTDGKIVEVYNCTPLLKEFYTRAWVQSVVQNEEEDGSVTMRPTSKKRFSEDATDRTKEEAMKVLNSWTVFDECNNPAIRLSVYEGFEKDFKLDDAKGENEKIEDPEKVLRRSIDEMKDNSQKACLIGELRSTEENYVDKSLHRLVFDYMPVIDMLKQDVPPSLVGKSRIIFGNADILYQKHKHKFLPCLLQCRTTEDIGKCFLKHESIFKLYPLYSKNKPKSENIMRVCGSYFRRRQDELKDRLDLSSYLLTPIQRMAKYCLIVKALIKECDKEHIPCDTLKKASVMLHRQMQMGNDMIALDSILGYNGNLREQGELLQRDLFLIMPPNKQSSFDGMVFLFQQSILITAISLQNGMEKFIFKDIINVTDMGYTNNVDEPQIFKVWFRKHDQKQYTLKARNADVHNKWVTEIFNLLWRQLEANKTKRKKELEENGIQVKTVPLQRPASIPNNHRTLYKPSLKTKSSSYNSFKKLKKKPDTTWYEKN